MIRLLAILLLLCAPQRAAADTPSSACTAPTVEQAKKRYRWHRRHSGYESLACRIPAPKGFTRDKATANSYAHWLRHLPLFPKKRPVRSYRGGLILEASSPYLSAVVDLDLSKRDRQQCADTIMRLRGEYHFYRGKPQRTRFKWAGGKRFGYDQWARGIRPVKGNNRKWTFEAKARPGRGYLSFRRYLEFMFSWTGTLHMVGEMRIKPAALRAGDFFIQGGSPGHAVVILDLARSADGKKVKALLGQGFIPAQDLHVLRAPDRSPWFTLDATSSQVKTPLWRPFSWSDLRRFRY